MKDPKPLSTVIIIGGNTSDLLYHHAPNAARSLRALAINENLSRDKLAIAQPDTPFWSPQVNNLYWINSFAIEAPNRQ